MVRDIIKLSCRRFNCRILSRHGSTLPWFLPCPMPISTHSWFMTSPTLSLGNKLHMLNGVFSASGCKVAEMSHLETAQLSLIRPQNIWLTMLINNLPSFLEGGEAEGCHKCRICYPFLLQHDHENSTVVDYRARDTSSKHRFFPEWRFHFNKKTSRDFEYLEYMGEIEVCLFC